MVRTGWGDVGYRASRAAKKVESKWDDLFFAAIYPAKLAIADAYDFARAHLFETGAVILGAVAVLGSMLVASPQAVLLITGLGFAQNIAFSVTSRSRNRGNTRFHLIAAVGSNGVWFATFRALVRADMTWVLFLPYCVSTVAGSICGVRISMMIERLLGATADGHVKADRVTELERAVKGMKSLVNEATGINGELEMIVHERLDQLETKMDQLYPGDGACYQAVKDEKGSIVRWDYSPPVQASGSGSDVKKAESNDLQL
jgi:hypothetical protein